MTTITFRGGETTGGVADRKIETAKQETTGSVGVRQKQDSIFTVDNDLRQDTVCFRANYYDKPEQKKSSVLGRIVAGTAFTALVIGGLGLMHKYDVVGKIKSDKAKEFFRHTDTVTEPCHKACAWIKKNCYDKIVNIFKK